MRRLGGRVVGSSLSLRGFILRYHLLAGGKRYIMGSSIIKFAANIDEWKRGEGRGREQGWMNELVFPSPGMNREVLASRAYARTVAAL